MLIGKRVLSLSVFHAFNRCLCLIDACVLTQMNLRSGRKKSAPGSLLYTILSVYLMMIGEAVFFAAHTAMARASGFKALCAKFSS